MAVKAIPEGYHTVTPYITVDNAGAVIDFLKKAFDAQESFAMRDDKGNVQHAEVKVGNSIVMLGSSHDQWKARPANFYVYVEDCDAVYKQALAAGGTSLSEPRNPVLRRPARWSHRLAGQQLVDRHPCRGRFAGRPGAPG